MELNDYKSDINALFMEAALKLSEDEFSELIDWLHDEGWGF